MTQAAITSAATPLCELPAEALRVAATFAGAEPGLDHVSIRQSDTDGEVIVTGCSGLMCAEVRCDGQATAELLLPIRPLRVALRRLPAEHASVVAGDAGMQTLRLYCPDSTLAMQMPLAGQEGVRLPVVEPGDQVAQLAISGAVLAQASARLTSFGVLNVETIGHGWLLSGEADGLRVRALLAGIAPKPRP